MNVTEDDLKIERAVMAKLSAIYPSFSGLEFEQNIDNPTALFDFYGYSMGYHRASVDVKASYKKPDEYPTNIVSTDKWNEFIQMQPKVDHYLVYYYPEEHFVRVYDLDRVFDVVERPININHIRTGINQTDVVMVIRANQADFIKEGFYI